LFRQVDCHWRALAATISHTASISKINAISDVTRTRDIVTLVEERGV
jgi:hypothetical protein